LPEPILLGCVVGAHGLRGEVRVRYFGDGPENLCAAAPLLLRKGAKGVKATALQPMDVEKIRSGSRPKEVLIQFAGVAGREAAEELRGSEVYAEEAVLEALPEGEYYWYQLVGCRVEALDGRVVGVVRSLWDVGAHDLLVVESEAGGEVLIPTSREVLREVDLAERVLRIEAIPGLLDGDAPVESEEEG